MADDVVVQRDASVLIVTLNRPDARNAVNQSMAEGVAAALETLDTDPDVFIGIITGAGGSCCAGMDLKAFLRGERPEIEGRGFAGITEAPPRKPVIAAVEGHAVAGGCELVLACDLVVAAEDAMFGLPEVRRGLVAGSGGLIRLPRRIPVQIAMEYALTGEFFSAVDARAWGLVNKVTPRGGALGAAIELAHKISANGPLAVQMTKHIVVESANWPAAEAWDRQRPLVESVIASEDAREGALAFAEKRPAVWRGK